MDESDESTSICADNKADGCSSDKFRCLSGQCINAAEKCDGTYHCSDNSDEIISTCWNIKCPGFLHRCSYGACVDGNAQCNGVKDCADGSDEEASKCGKKNATISIPSRVDFNPVTLPDTPILRYLLISTFKTI